MRFVTEDNEPVSLDYDRDIYCIDINGQKIARFTGSHPIMDAIDNLSEDDPVDIEIICTPEQWDGWTVLPNVAEKMIPILQRFIASCFTQQEATSRLLIELLD